MRIGNREDETPVAMSITVPDGWGYKESFTILEPRGRANVIFSSEPLDDESITGDEYATVQGDVLKTDFRGYREIAYEDIALPSEGVAKLRVFEWEPEGDVPITQAQVYYVISHRGFTATATAASADFQDFEAILMDVLRSIAIVAKTAAGTVPM